MGQGIDLEVICLVSPSEDGTEALLGELGVEVIIDDAPGRHLAEIDGHLWGNPDRYLYMTRLRNRLLKVVLERDPDYFLSLDSDIILPLGALGQLIAYAKATGAHIVSPALNMAIGAQAWNTMNWKSGSHLFTAARDYVPVGRSSVDVVMAAILMDRSALRVCHWRAHEQGEDVGFSVVAQENGILRWWLPDVICQHLMQRSWLPAPAD